MVIVKMDLLILTRYGRTQLLKTKGAHDIGV